MHLRYGPIPHKLHYVPNPGTAFSSIKDDRSGQCYTPSYFEDQAGKARIYSLYGCVLMSKGMQRYKALKQASQAAG